MTDPEFLTQQRARAHDLVVRIFGNDGELSDAEVERRIMYMRHCSEREAVLTLSWLKSIGAIEDDQKPRAELIVRTVKRKRKKREQQQHNQQRPRSVRHVFSLW